MRRAERLVDKLVALADKVQGRYRLAAVVYDDRFRPISFGTNSYIKTHPLQAQFSSHPLKVFVHAEIQALVRANGRRKHGIMVLRIDRFRRLQLARPCKSCMAAVLESGIREIVYSNRDGKLVRETWVDWVVN